MCKMNFTFLYNVKHLMKRPWFFGGKNLFLGRNSDIFWLEKLREIVSVVKRHPNMMVIQVSNSFITVRKLCSLDLILDACLNGISIALTCSAEK